MALKFNPTTGQLDIDSKLSLTTLDTIYLKLDASNDPVTGNLKIVPATGTTGISLIDAPVSSSYYTKMGFDSTVNATPSGSQNFTGGASYLNVNSATTSTGFLAGIDTGLVNNITLGQTASTMYGMNMTVYNYQRGTVTNLYGGFFGVYNDQYATGTVTNSYSGYFLNQRTGGTSTNQYGVYVAAVTGATNNYAIFTNSGLNELNDQLFIDGSADRIQLIVQAHSTQTANLTEWQNSSGTVLANITQLGGAVFNETGADTDFRVEGDTDTHLFFIDASSNRIGIGTSNPSQTLEVNSASGIQMRIASAGAYRGGFVIDTGVVGQQSVFILAENGTEKYQIGKNSDGEQSFFVYDSANSKTVFDYFGVTGTMRIMPTSGSVSIGSNYSPGAKLLVEGDASAKTVIFRASATTPGNITEWQNSSGTVQLAIAGNGRDFILDSTTGTKIGTATAQKLGFYNATPIVQPTAYTVSNVTSDKTYDANATTTDELADVLGTLITDLKALGLIG